MPGEACHAFVIAPASATTLARLANGLADDMLSCQALAFPEKLVIAPAMNPLMWHNAATQ
jgi:phosphopantothenoylcysteine decarboxylase/phosphopantothenate--cysteine ligase